MAVSVRSQNGSNSTDRRWEIVTVCQVIAIFIVLITCVINLSIGTDKAELWSSLLSGGLGYLLPSPKYKKNGTLLLNSTQQQFPHLQPGWPIRSNCRGSGNVPSWRLAFPEIGTLYRGTGEGTGEFFT